LLSEV
ncbi:hypothetical protein VCPCS023_003763B, partial [Vibrio cholerae O1 str. PCS-023]